MLSYKAVLLAVLASSAVAVPLSSRPLPRYTLAGREVPQEHSHEDIIRSVRDILGLNNPDGFLDPVFALLGNAAAAQGLGNLDDADCLQQAIADQAFTNAKEIDDIDGMTDALIFRALERNSGTVGGVTAPCLSVVAVNPEIAVLQQHQDPASDDAAAVNKEIALNLAVQIASIGGDPLRAIESGTFPPGEIGDPTGAGNTCDDENDANGCINTLGLLVPDVSADEIDEALADAGLSVGVAVDDVVDDVSADDVGVSAVSGIGDFGLCSIPEIEFGVGFDGRKETSFRPVDLVSFNHGSAQGFGIIGDFICDTLINTCGADQLALDTCALALAAAAAEIAKTGAQADAFNAVFGINTNFANVAAIDDQGRVVVLARSEPVSRRVRPARMTKVTRQAGDFGSCSVPEISFGIFEGRKETSFIPADLASFNHGSAQNFDIIGQFVCDQLVNSCGADQVALDTCAQAILAAQAETPKTGAQADAFNAVFGISTNFAAVQALDNQGQAVAKRADNFQVFGGALGGAAPAVTEGGRGFEVAGSDDFLNVGAALGRSCDIQHNACANAANSGAADISVQDCDEQNNACRALIQ